MRKTKFGKCIIAAVLICACFMSAVCLTSCSRKGKPLMKLDKSELSVNIFQLYLSRMKGTLCSVDYFGANAKQDDFWDTWYDVYEKVTYNKRYTDSVLETAKNYLAALALYDEKKLELSKSKIDEIDATMTELLNSEAEGSKAAFNAILGEFGVNYEMLREAYIIEAKVDQLQDELFGADGSKIGSELVKKYYEGNYARFKQVFLYTYENQYVTDRNGDVMYFTDDKKISYDTSAQAKKNGNGDYVADENGDRVYVYTDSNGKEHIAYKKEGASSERVLDANGNPMTVKYNETEKAQVYREAQEILAKTEKGNTLGFDVIATQYGNDTDRKDYPDGYYVTRNTNYASPQVIKKLFELEVGETAIVESDYGYHIIMRYELEDLATVTEKENYDDIFISQKTGTYVFLDTLKSELLLEYITPYKERITVDEKLYATVDIKGAGVNFYY